MWTNFAIKKYLTLKMSDYFFDKLRHSITELTV